MNETIQIRKVLCALIKLSANNVRTKIPSACPKNEREEAKRTAEDFFSTRFYEDICDVLNLSSGAIKKQVLSEKNKYDEIEDVCF